MSGDKGYVEEVDIEVIDHSGADLLIESEETGFEDNRHAEEDDNDYYSATLKPKKASGDGIVSRNSSVASNQIPGEIFNRLSNNIKSGLTKTSGSSSQINLKSSAVSRGSTGSAAGPKDSVSNSWARSSGGRYSTSVDENEQSERDQVDEEGRQYCRESNDSNDYFEEEEHDLSTLKNNMKLLNQRLNTGRDEEEHYNQPEVVASRTAPSTAQAKSAADESKATTNASHGDGRKEEIRQDGTKVVYYRNGTIKEAYPDGKTLVRFTNGDTKFTDQESGAVVYFYAQANTTHTSFPDGLELYEFPNGQVCASIQAYHIVTYSRCFFLRSCMKQIEKHFPNGIKEVIFPDETTKIIYPDGTNVSLFQLTNVNDLIS